MPQIIHPVLTIKFSHLKQCLDHAYWMQMRAFDDAFEEYDNGPADLPWIIDTGKP